MQGNDMEMYSSYKAEKSVVAKIFIRTSKNKIYECLITV